MTWTILSTNQTDSAAIDLLGNKFLIGNGYIGIRGTLDEHTKDQKAAINLSGLYDQVGEAWREPINLPNGGYTQVYYQGKLLGPLSDLAQNHTQSLDIRHAVHQRQTDFLTPEGASISIHSQRFASLANPHLECIVFSVTASHPVELILRTGIDGDVWDLNGPHLERFKACSQDNVLSLSAETHQKAVPIAVSETARFSSRDETRLHTENCMLREIRLVVTPEKPFVMEKFVAYTTAQDYEDPLEANRQLCAEAARRGYEALYQEHCALWEQRWQECDVRILGDEEAQLALRFSMYHLLVIAPSPIFAKNGGGQGGSRTSIPARGLSGQTYRGAIFWDTEMFMLPFFTHAFPSIARSLLLYRYYSLPGARRKARQYGFRGAFYAWESQDDGEDACTLFNVTDVFTNRPLRTYFRDKQVHISADVVYAIWKYFTITGDASIFLDGAAEVVYECARFFLSSLYYSPEKRRYEVLDVTGPDEYHERVHNNAFTNWMVGQTLEACLKVHDYLEEHFPDQSAALIEKLDFAGDLASIREAASGLYLPAPDPQTGLIPQFDGYFTLEDVPLKDLLARKLHPYEYLGGGSGLATTTQILKQADVVLGLFLFSERYSQAVKAANWEYYEPRTEHGSSLSACSYSLIAAQIGKTDWAYRYFMKTAVIDLTGEGKQYVGTLYIGGTHPAANGGAWMSAVLGLCGLRCEGRTLSLDPHLPAHWSEVVLPVSIQGEKIGITLRQDETRVKRLAPIQGQALYLAAHGLTYEIPSSGELVLR